MSRLLRNVPFCVVVFSLECALKRAPVVRAKRKCVFQQAALRSRLGLKVNWRSLRTSCATWMVQAGADPKSVQDAAHAHSTTMNIYAQFVPEGQKQAQKELKAYVERPVPHVPIVFQ